MFGFINNAYSITWPDGHVISSSIPPISNETIIIEGTTYIENNAIVNITSSDLHFENDANIIVRNDAELHITFSDFFNIGNNLYQGISLVDQSFLEMRRCKVQGARELILSTEVSSFEIIDNSFFDNEITLKLINMDWDHTGIFHSNTIKYTGSLYPIVNPSNVKGIVIEDVKPITPGYKLTIGDNSNSNYINIIQDFPNGAIPIYVFRADVKFINASIQQNNASNGIEIAGSNTISYISNVDLQYVDIQNTNQTLNNHCVTIENYANTYIYECNFNDADISNVYYNNNTGDAIIENSVFNSENASDAGLHFYNTNSLNTSSVNNSDFNYDDNNGIKIEGSDNIEIINSCEFNAQSVSGKGINVTSNSANIDISGSTFNMGDNSYGIYCFDHSNNINIYTNEFFSSSSGTGIEIKNNCDQVNIEDANNFYFANDHLGRCINVDHSFNINIIGNNIGHSLSYQKVATGIRVINDCETVTIDDNNIYIDLKNAIYVSDVDDVDITGNIIGFSSATNNHKIGISVNNLDIINHRNNITDNNIDIINYVSFSPQAYEGIYVENSPQTNIISNTISGAGYAMHLKSDNSNGKVACNNLLNSYQGIHLEDAIWGEFNGSYFLIGLISKPPVTMDNYWNNIAVSDGRVKGNIMGIYNQVYYYKNQAGYNLDNTMHNVTSIPGNGNFTSTLLSNSQSYCGSKSNSLSNTKIGNNPEEERKALVAYAIDTISIMQNNTASYLNPQNIYAFEQRYASVKNAYYNYKKYPQFQNLGLASDLLFNNFEYKIDNSNIHYNYITDMLIKNNKYNQALNQISYIQANNLGEINTLNAYNKLIQYYTTDSLSSADSSLLSGIAYQNPSTGGQSVYIARNLLGLYIIDTNNTFNSSYSMANNVTSLQNNDKNDFIEILPNPAKNSLNINLSLANEGVSDIKIYSIEGRVVYKNSFNNYSFNTVDISNLEKGAYFIKITDKESIIYKDKLIKL